MSACVCVCMRFWMAFWQIRCTNEQTCDPKGHSLLNLYGICSSAPPIKGMPSIGFFSLSPNIMICTLYLFSHQFLLAHVAIAAIIIFFYRAIKIIFTASSFTFMAWLQLSFHNRAAYNFYDGKRTIYLDFPSKLIVIFVNFSLQIFCCLLFNSIRFSAARMYSYIFLFGLFIDRKSLFSIYAYMIRYKCWAHTARDAQQTTRMCQTIILHSFCVGF